MNIQYYLLTQYTIEFMQVTVFIANMQLDISAAFMQMKVSVANICVTVSIEIMHVGVPVPIMQVVFSAVHDARDYFYCNYTGSCFFCSYVYVCHSFK